MVVAVGMTSGMIIGTALGLAAGFIGGIVDEIIMRLVDAWIALPFIMLALVIKIVLGTSFTIMFLILVLISWVGFVRPVRGEVLSLRERDYVYAARVAGASGFRIAFRHILPGVSSTVIVLATLGAGGLVLAEATLSYLGVGIPQPTPTWGNMVSDGRDYLDTAWWISTMPGIAIFLLVLSLNFTRRLVARPLGPQATAVVNAPDLVAIGHVTWDVLPGDLRGERTRWGRRVRRGDCEKFRH